MAKKIKWLAVEFGMWTALYLAKFQANLAAWNVLRFFIVFAFIVAFTVPTEKIREVLSKTGRSVPGWLTWALDLLFVFILVSFGHYLYGAMVLITTALVQDGFDGKESIENR